MAIHLTYAWHLNKWPVKLAELLEKEGVDIIQTEGGKCSNPTKPGVLGLIEKVTQNILHWITKHSSNQREKWLPECTT